jgi:3'-phosphoadenosine 5'-phosphosulfate sulfotransferase (PAPS reductase)/FAD synthetase
MTSPAALALTEAAERPQHIVNLSGGKDSQACAILAKLRGKPFRLVMADTGNESPITLDHAQYVAEFVGVPLEIARADFTQRMAGKRDFIERRWADAGVPADRIERALAVLQPTGNPFLDLCLWKGRFPSRKAQFCTEFLKSEAVENAVVAPALALGPVVQWLGVRRDESLNRRNAPMFHKVRRDPNDVLFFRPIIHWTAENVFSFTDAMGARHNPLYRHGMGRVGCFPCINANKAELRQIGLRFPEVVEKLREWEDLVADASKRGAATFFASDVTPEGGSLGKRLRRIKDADTRQAALNAAPWPKVDEVFAWARTARGGRQFDLLHHAFDVDEGLSCSSQYGLCE